MSERATQRCWSDEITTIDGVRYARLDRIWLYAEPGEEFVETGLVHPTDDEAPDECHTHYAEAVFVLTQRKAYDKPSVAWLIAEAARLGRVPVLRNERGELLPVHQVEKRESSK